MIELLAATWWIWLIVTIVSVIVAFFFFVLTGADDGNCIFAVLWILSAIIGSISSILCIIGIVAALIRFATASG
jgi:hypothetical protein